MKHRRYVGWVISGTIGLLIAVACFNYKIDPANIFRNVFVETCGNWLLEGHNVAVTQNYDERLLQKYLIEHDSKRYDVLVLGSSRTMDIGSSLFPNYTFKNYSVSGASIEDDIALYFLYERMHGVPKKVLIGADAWLLNVNNGQERWKSVANEYEYGKNYMLESNKFFFTIDVEKCMQLISWPYLNESIKKAKKDEVRNIDRGYCLADESATVATNAEIICPDGMHIHSADMQAKDAELLAMKYIAGNVYSLEKYDEINAELQAQVKMFISYLKSAKVEIVIYLTPYHPVVYSYLIQNEQYRNVMEAETFFREAAIEFGLKIAGSYNPERCGLSNEDFLDGMHMRQKAVAKLLQEKI